MSRRFRASPSKTPKGVGFLIAVAGLHVAGLLLLLMSLPEHPELIGPSTK